MPGRGGAVPPDPRLFDVTESLLERQPFRHLPHDLARAVEVALEPREADDPRRQPSPTALLEDPLLLVRLVEPPGDALRPDVPEDLVDVALVPQDRPVHGLEGLDHLQPRFLRHNRLVLEPPRRAISRDDDPQLVAEFPRLAEEIQMAGMEEIEDPRRHYTDHERHARTTDGPSRAYAFACSFGRARPSSAI